jgi:mRNA-degrading endonuclease toxin of MazEF toxin-antitoxin module
MSDGLNKYLHGTVWVYPTPEKKRGAKRLALIISDSQANFGSPTVNVVVAVSGATNEYINVPLNMDAGYQIQCDQIHTVAKEELTEYAGALPTSLLASVKSKIRAHFNLDEGDSSRAELKKAVVGMTAALSRMVSEDEYAAPPANYTQISKETELQKISPKTENDTVSPESEASPVAETPPKAPKPAKKSTGRKKVEKSAKISTKTGKPVRKLRKYNDEEKAFIADTANSTDDIMKRFELTDKKQAHALRNYIRNRLGKQENQETPESEQ